MDMKQETVLPQTRHNFLNDSLDLHSIDTDHRDACALICSIRKGGQPTHGNVKRTIEALARMGHRTGYINGEGDGVGVLTDIPRQLWSQWLAEAGMIPSMATDRNFWVAHVMIPAQDRNRARPMIERICQAISRAGLHILVEREGVVNRHVLGPNAEKNEPAFWQIAGVNGQVKPNDLEATLFSLQTRLEDEMDVHFPSFSSFSVVYKVQGTIEILRRYYPELRDPAYASTITMGHARYSTNTNPIFERAQPFSVIGHNGEFNTISRFRLEANMLEVPLTRGGSDSQDVDRVVHALCAKYGLDLIEAMEYIFPPYDHDLIQNDYEIERMYEMMHQAYGRFAQGPAAVAARMGNMCVFSVDALGLRPLWFGQTEKEYFASSERGVYPLDVMSENPKPLAPGEKVALKITPGYGIELLEYPAIQNHVLNKYRQRYGGSPLIQHADFGTNGQNGSYNGFDGLPQNGNGHDDHNGNGLKAAINGNGSHGTRNGRRQTDRVKAVATGAVSGTVRQTQVAASVQTETVEVDLQPELEAEAGQLELVADVTPAPQDFPWNDEEIKLNDASMSALGWERYHPPLVEAMAERGKELIGSLGWDGALAAMAKTRVNLADYFKETVAVVTNPAIDREREQAQFSTRVVLGVRPDVIGLNNLAHEPLQLDTPLIPGGYPGIGDINLMTELADEHGSATLEYLFEYFAGAIEIISLHAETDQGIDAAIERIQKEAVAAVNNGAQCLILDDSAVFAGEKLWIDPLLATAAVDKALRLAEASPNLRRRAGIVLRSGSLRDLHDIALCLSMGANAIVPYAMYAVAIGIAPRGGRNVPEDDFILERMNSIMGATKKGLEKIIATIGCHDLRGYGHSFSSIGLAKGVAKILGTPNYFGSEARGLTWSAMKNDAESRADEFAGKARARLQNPDRFYPKVWKKVEDLAQGDGTLEDYTEALLKNEEKIPVSIRHLLDIAEKDPSEQVSPDEVDIRIGRHDMPVLISAMSFGSQGELAYRTYAEAAYRLNILCVNGEGGELADLMGKYPHNRGQQVASGRFGVNIGFLNSCNLVEIKIGQGAKPGEGGHLPGFKVTEQVAAARSTTPGVALISPGNNHDLYSIEDLAQLIDELKTANPNARISVKIPVVPGVGIIAVGVAKAGADIITVTGYTGGTGAARAHALRHVGLPAEIGVWLSHRALIDSGLRDDVELWVDGGMKSGRDVVKMLCLGANRVGFGTLAMVAVGCTICRGCHEGTCHVGITTHVKTREEAEQKDFKAFRPFEEKGSPDGIVRVFKALEQDIKIHAAKLGVRNLQDLVGRADLLEQNRMIDRIDLSPLLKPAPAMKVNPAQPGGRRVSRPRNIISRQMTEVVAEYLRKGDTELTYDDEQVMAMDRALGTHLCGAIKRRDLPEVDRIEAINLSFSNSAVPGNGLGAFLDLPVNILVEGGGQDGVAKCARGGNIHVLKGLNHNGRRLDGSVGKSFAYGAQGGSFIVQGDADTRACIRMSGADVVFGGEVVRPLQDHLGNLGTRSNLKGYAFEYMTSGRVLVLGDPGPWICSGMTGGTVYQRLDPAMNLTEDAIRRRIAPGAPVEIFDLDENGIADIRDLLGTYIQVLELNNQPEAAVHLYDLLQAPEDHFIKIAPVFQ